MLERETALLWTPDDKTRENAHLTRYMRWLKAHKRLSLDHYPALWAWSAEHPEAFWETAWEYFQVISHTPYRQVLSGYAMPGARWFEGATLNYAEHVFRCKSPERPALIFQNERGQGGQLGWADLERQVAALAQFLRQNGVQRGDRIAAYLPNTPHAAIAVLAAMSIGAVWSSCSPDFGVSSVVDRFAQIEPKILIAVDGYTYNGKPFDKREAVRDICRQLPSLQRVVFVPYLDEQARPEGLPGAVLWDEALQTPANGLAFEPLPFEHPLWILYSSGTTGVPKAIVHSHGGNLLEHLKYLHFHNDVHPGERFFWYSTTGWMMWNFTIGSLLAGATAVLYDGSPAYPSLDVLWKLAEEARITHFGTSAPFIVSCRKAGLSPKDAFDLSALRSIGSTGSPLPPEGFRWVYERVKPDVWLSSMSGGTDVCTAWVGGNPLLPVYEGEIQCRCLGCAMESWDEDGRPVPPGEVGEMVVTRPMPSMPVFFWNDPDGSKYRSSYFEHYPGVWRHGDWLCITPRQTLVILGRSDATLNRQGVRIGTAEIYRALDKIPGIRDALILNIERPDGSDWMPLFVLLEPGAALDDDLQQRIRQTLRTECSPRHVPDAIIAAPDIPYTISGKKMETPVKKILQKKPLDKAYNPDSMRNPEAMQFFIEWAKKLL
ncbi:MAG: acetoacetate--CoA ligase [Saprospiraceae bacterium]|nr:acetoacetate--CoA ligase [Saprospiraceae bacterium]MDW8229372.1 acetoacetate--CoA ligase [Saprospiraceae bacterium]